MKNSIILLCLILAGFARATELEPIFNRPGFDGKVIATVEDKLIELTRQALPGSSIRAALYEVDRVPMAEALIEASKRGVNVELLFDGGNLANKSVPGHAISRLVNELQCAPGNDCLKFCKGPLSPLIKLTGIKKEYPLGNSCRGLIINHNKLFLFSELNDGSKDVVAQTSANMAENMMNMYNDLILVKNDLAFFKGFNEYWDRLKKDHTVFFKDSFHNLETADKKVKAYFFPRMTGSDPVLNLLKRVNCNLPGSSIRVLQSVFTRKSVAQQMKKLESEGCALQVITRIDPVAFSPGKGVVQALGNSMIVLAFDGKLPEEKQPNSSHTKLVLINASIDNSPEKAAVVLTGSHNLDLFSLRTNDETLLEIRDQEIFDKYDAFISQYLDDARAANVRIF